MLHHEVSLLIIEDDPDIRTLLRDRLEHRGYLVLEAQDGLEGLRLAEDPRVAGVLLDQHIPSTNGLSVLTELRQRRPDLPVVIMSAAEIGRTALSAGAQAYLIKPLDFSALSAVMARFFPSPRLSPSASS